MDNLNGKLSGNYEAHSNKKIVLYCMYCNIKHHIEMNSVPGIYGYVSYNDFNDCINLRLSFFLCFFFFFFACMVT